MARAFVTGGAGFIGSALIRHLLANGDEVLALVRASTDPWRLADLGDRLEICPGAIGSVLEWRAAVRDFAPDRVFHCAWYAEPGKYLDDPKRNLECLSASQVLLSEVASLRPAAIVTVGTCFEYDTSLGDPLLEDVTPERPRHEYSTRKLELKQFALELGHAESIPIVHARIFYLHGPREDGRRLIPFVVSRLRAAQPVQLRSHGLQVRDFLHVEDVARGLACAADARQPMVVNIASGLGLTVRELVLQIADTFGRRDLISFADPATPLDEPMSVVGDPKRLRALGFEPLHWPAAARFAATDEPG